MRDGYDVVVADRFTVLDQVPVPDIWSRVLDRVSEPDTWSRVRNTEQVVTEVSTMVDLETKAPTEPRPRMPMRVVAGILAAAAVVVVIALVATSDDDADQPADEPVATVTVPPTLPPRALFGTPDEPLAPGTYFVDEFEGTPTVRVRVTIGDGWTSDGDWSAGMAGGGFVTFSRPDRVFLDACHSIEGFHPGPMTTLDGLVAALTEQLGWADVTASTDISIDGYTGKAFRRTAPAEFSDCSTSFAPFRSWENDGAGEKGWSYYEPGEIETVWVLDVDGTIVIINTRLLPGQPAEAAEELAAVLDSIRIEPA